MRKAFDPENGVLTDMEAERASEMRARISFLEQLAATRILTRIGMCR
jgi:hypothetical protein